MKGPLSLLAALLLVTYITPCVAQDDDDENATHFAFGLDYGISTPKGDYASANTNQLPMSRFTGQDTNRLNGYAKTGIHFQVYFSYRFIPYLGVIVAAGGDQNTYNIKALNAQYTTYFPPNTVLATTGDNYYVIQYMAGPYFNIPILKYLGVQYLGFECKPMYGYCTANYPGITFTGLPDNHQNSTIPKAGTGTGYNIAAGFKFTTADEAVGIHLDVSYEGTKITYPGYQETTYNSAYNSFVSTNYAVPKTLQVSMFQLTLGASYEF